MNLSRKLHARMRKIVGLSVLLCTAGALAAQNTWLSGQDSPVHDSDRLTLISGQTVTLENADVKIGFDAVSGALVDFKNKRTGWNIQKSPELGQSFRVFAPTADRSYSPVLGARNHLASIEKSSDGRSLTLVWKSLVSEYRGTLDVTLTGTVTLDGPDIDFDMEIKNNGGWTITTVDWPIIGALNPPSTGTSLRRMNPVYGNLTEIPLWPKFQDQRGYFGTNHPIQMGEQFGMARYNLVLAGDQGLYLGTHDIVFDETTRYTFEMKPGFVDSFDARVPQDSAISGHPVRIVASMEHFPFVPSGSSMKLARTVLSPFEGDWHHGANVYKRWRASWFHPPIGPSWVEGVNSWQQLQIDSAEDDLRTPYGDLRRRAEEAAKAGINAIQLVGWNNGGQDRGNPSHDTDPRLGSYDDLKKAIAQIEAMGIHVILFNKYVWVDTSTPAYENGLKDHVAHDPNGQPYIFGGYQYQTPEQLADINTRRLAVACTPDHFWQDLSAREFKKSIDLGASGILYDEVCWHGGASYCFSHKNGQLVAQSIWAGDSLLGQRFHDVVRNTVGEKNFLLAGENPYDLEQRYYRLMYIRISPGHVPVERYDDPFLPIMIAATGFDDREMINQALRYRYIISYEPFNFKGNLSDFPLTLAYGVKVDSLRRRYQDYVWDAEFRDSQDAEVTVSGKPFSSFSVFKQSDGKHAVVIVNNEDHSVEATVSLDHAARGLVWASPEYPDPHPFSNSLKIPARSAVIVMEK